MLIKYSSTRIMFQGIHIVSLFPKSSDAKMRLFADLDSKRGCLQSLLKHAIDLEDLISFLQMCTCLKV